MDACRSEAVRVILAAAQTQLEALGQKCLLSPTSLPQGHTVALIVGETDLAIAGAHVALSIGGASAHSAEGGPEFEHQVADLLTDFAVIHAARHER